MSENGAALALSTIAIVPTIFGSALPPLSVVADKGDVSGAMSQNLQRATVCASVVVAGVALLTRSPAVLLAGGATVVAYSAMYRQAVAA